MRDNLKAKTAQAKEKGRTNSPHKKVTQKHGRKFKEAEARSREEKKAG